MPKKNSPHPLSRRDFIAFSSAVSAAAVLRSSPLVMAADAAGESGGKRRIPIGLELYSVRTELGKDLPNTLKTVAKIGYEVVEFYSPYLSWNYPYAKQVRTMLDDLGMRCYSTHNSIQALTPGDGIAKGIELNQILGSRSIVLASAPGSTKGLDGWKKLCEQLTAAVEHLKPHGLTAGFHNHQVEWKQLDNGQRIMDVIAANTPKEFVLQLDVGTCVEAGADPVAWIKSHPGRTKSIHIKDWAPGDRSQEKGYRVLFTEGTSPWKEIFAAAESVGGIEHYLMEQEGSRFSEFETAQRCLDTWKKFRANG